MKAFLIVLFSCLAFAGSVMRLHGSPPANDNFTNRIVLAGHSNIFTANLAEATFELNEQYADFHSWPTSPVGTIWRSWTARDFSPMTLQLLEFSQPSYDASNISAVKVWLAGNTNLGYPQVLGTGYTVAALFDLRPLTIPHIPNSLTFTSAPGATYLFQVGGRMDLEAKLALIATNPPIIVQQPRGLTVSTNASALFTVIADGLHPLGYQWRFNGFDMPGETGVMMAQTNLAIVQAGCYSVVVSNVSGMVTSEVAHLYVNLDESRPALELRSRSSSNGLAFALNGEIGRSYRIQTSTNLIQWSEEKAFPLAVSWINPRLVPLSTSVVFATNGSASVCIPANSNPKFARAARYVPPNEICNLHLKQLRFATDVWGRDHPLFSYPSDFDLAAYFNAPRGDYIATHQCPLGGVSVHSYVGDLPVCTIPGHILEEPK